MGPEDMKKEADRISNMSDSELEEEYEKIIEEEWENLSEEHGIPVEELKRKPIPDLLEEIRESHESSFLEKVKNFLY